MYLPFAFYWDPTFFLIIPAMILSIIAQATVSSRFSKYSKVPVISGVSGVTVAQSILSRNGVFGVTVKPVGGSMNDHFDPRKNTIALSEPVYGKASITAAAVAAHETGHALQYAHGYGPMKLRSALAPVVNIATTISFPLFLIGIIFGISSIATIGAVVFGVVFVFQLVTLPVEYNASRRALDALSETAILSDSELASAKKVLSAAALTYVAAMLMAMMQFLRLLLLARRRD